MILVPFTLISNVPDEAVRETGKLEGRLSALQGQLDEAKAEVRRLQSSK